MIPVTIGAGRGQHRDTSSAAQAAVASFRNTTEQQLQKGGQE